MNLNQNSLLEAIDKQVETLKACIPKPNSALKVCIAIPAKNEENYLQQTLESLCNQVGNEGKLLDKTLFEVIVLCHNCTDATYNKAIKFKNENSNINLHILELNSDIINNIGGARRVLMHISATRLTSNDSWIVSTDADTVPNTDWIYHIMNQSKNIDMVCGKILVDTSNLNDDVKKLLEAKQIYNSLKTHLEHLIVPNQQDPWPKHNNHSGPNMALRKNVYLSINGIPPIAFLEDIQLFNRVKKFGYSIRHDINLVVETSGRTTSKTAFGLGSELNYWSNKEIIYSVEDLNTLITRFSIYKKIKEVFYKYDPILLEEISNLSFIKKPIVESYHTESAIYEEMNLKIEEELETNKQWKEARPLKNIFEVNISLESYIISLIPLSFAKV